MTGAHRRRSPCPAWCGTVPHTDLIGDVVVHRTVPLQVAGIVIGVSQVWGPRLGWLAPRVHVSRHGSGRALQLTLPDDVRALAEVLNTPEGALQLRARLYEVAEQFALIRADCAMQSGEAR